jgi:hypothetical protein
MRASRARFAVGIAVAGVLAATGAAAATDDQRGKGRSDTARFRAVLTGYEEVGPNGIAAVSTSANGGFRAALARDGESIDWTLSYTELEDDIQQAHIHLGQRATAGGVSTVLCTNLGNSPGTKWPSGEIRGQIGLRGGRW